MNGNKYTRDQVALIRQAIRRYKYENGDWRSKYRDDRKGAYVNELAKHMPEHTRTSIMFKFNTILRGGRPPSNNWSASYGRKISEKGREALSQNGREQWSRIKQNLRSFGLTDEQIAKAFSRRSPRLSKDQVAEIESAINSRGRCRVDFSVDENDQSIIKMTVMSILPSGNELTAETRGSTIEHVLEFPAANI